MQSIILDETKFKWFGQAINIDYTSKMEFRIQHQLLQLHKDNHLPQSLYEFIRPSGSQRLRLFGLRKVHKKDISLRPILSKIFSAQHQLAKISSPFFNLLSPSIRATYCICDSFTFADIIKSSKLLFRLSLLF